MYTLKLFLSIAGKSLGALLGLIKNGNSFESLRCLYRGLAIAAAVVAVLYFLLYHFLLSPRCGAKSQPPPSTTTGDCYTEYVTV